jgi:protein TonB
MTTEAAPPPVPQAKPKPPPPRVAVTRAEPPKDAPPPAPAAAAPQQALAPPPNPGLAGGRTGARAIFQPPPQIPDELRRSRIDTVALVVFHVAADGSATVELRQATDDPRLNQVLLEGFRKWRFFPATEHDRPVASTIELRVPVRVQ